MVERQFPKLKVAGPSPAEGATVTSVFVQGRTPSRYSPLAGVSTRRVDHHGDDALRIDANKLDRITDREFCIWVGVVMSAHDRADIEGS